MRNKTKQGFLEHLSNDAYHASNGISKTGLDKVERSPAHFNSNAPFSQTRAMEIGSAIHCAILEPDRYNAEYTVADSIARNTKEYKSAAKENPLGKEFTLTTVESANVSGMRASVENNDEAMKYLSRPGLAELSAFAVDPETQIQLRSRYDWVTDMGLSWSGNSSVDVKKTQDVRDFRKSVESYNYHIQEAFYRHVYKLITGEELENFFFLAVEEKPPYTSKMFTLSPQMLEVGRFYMRKNINLYAECIRSGKWAGPNVNSVIEPSYWLNNKYQDDEQQQFDSSFT